MRFFRQNSGGLQVNVRGGKNTLEIIKEKLDQSKEMNFAQTFFC